MIDIKVDELIINLEEDSGDESKEESESEDDDNSLSDIASESMVTEDAGTSQQRTYFQL